MKNIANVASTRQVICSLLETGNQLGAAQHFQDWQQSCQQGSAPCIRSVFVGLCLAGVLIVTGAAATSASENKSAEQQASPAHKKSSAVRKKLSKAPAPQPLQAVHPVAYPGTNFQHYAEGYSYTDNLKEQLAPGVQPKFAPEAAHRLAEQVQDIFPRILARAGLKRAQMDSESKVQEQTGSDRSNHPKTPAPDKSPPAVPFINMAGSSILPAIALVLFWSLLAFMGFSSRKTKDTRAQKSAAAGNNSYNSNDDEKVNTARQWMQCARDQAAQAETAGSRAHVGSRDMRLAAADEAQCHADAARNWADRATDRAYNAGSATQSAAADARDAANRAQAAADRARYFAERATS